MTIVTSGYLSSSSFISLSQQSARRNSANRHTGSPRPLKRVSADRISEVRLTYFRLNAVHAAYVQFAALSPNITTRTLKPFVLYYSLSLRSSSRVLESSRLDITDVGSLGPLIIRCDKRTLVT